MVAVDQGNESEHNVTTFQCTMSKLHERRPDYMIGVTAFNAFPNHSPRAIDAMAKLTQLCRALFSKLRRLDVDLY